jgi:hypothetical protein
VRAQQRRSLGILALVFLGITLGVASGFWMGRTILLRAASQALSGYAGDMVGQSDKYDAVMAAVFDQLNHSTAPFCSPTEGCRASTQRASLLYRLSGAACPFVCEPAGDVCDA